MLKIRYKLAESTVVFNFVAESNSMQRNKKIFLVIFIIFMLIMMWIGYDISQRTTFPGSKGNLKERISTDQEQ